MALASVAGFLGAATKETGPLGLGAIGLLVVWTYRKQGIKILATRLASVCLPFIILYGVLFATISGSAPTLFDWFNANTTEYSGKGTYSVIKLVAVAGSTFGLYWLGVVYAIRMMIRERRMFDHIGYIVGALIATLPILMWPLFISRIVFIQFLWVMPLALYGYRVMSGRIQSRYPEKGKIIMIFVALVPIVFSAALFLVGARGSLFTLMH